MHIFLPSQLVHILEICIYFPSLLNHIKGRNLKSIFLLCFLSKASWARTSLRRSLPRRLAWVSRQLFLSPLTRQTPPCIVISVDPVVTKAADALSLNIQPLITEKQKVWMTVSSGKNLFPSGSSSGLALDSPLVSHHDSKWAWKLLGSLASWVGPRRTV